MEEAAHGIGTGPAFQTEHSVQKKFGYEPAPLVLAFVLAPMFENAFRQSLIISDCNPVIFFTRPIAAFFIIFSILLLISPLILSRFGKKRPGLLVKEED